VGKLSVDRAKKLLPQAASISNADFVTLANDPDPLKIKNQSLSMVLWSSGWLIWGRKILPGGTPTPSHCWEPEMKPVCRPRRLLLVNSPIFAAYLAGRMSESRGSP
jgi:hypothetical protein